MATNSHNSVGAARRLPQALLLVLAAGIVGAGHTKALPVYDEDEDDGRDVAAQIAKKPTVEAAFPLESYGPGSVARLVISDRARRVVIQVRRVGTESGPSWGNDTLTGVPMTKKRVIGKVAGRRLVKVRLGNWPSGVYFVQLTAPRGRVGYAPFVLRPRHLGQNRVAVVMPTETWQAYNHRDDDADGTPDTWYAGGHTARLGRPFLDRGTPPHFKQYEAWWLRWLVQTHKAVDIISDAELRHAANGRGLARAYSLLIFSGHHEYVTEPEYGAVTQFRDAGGNLIFRDARRFEWLLAGTGLGNGGKISNGGIEADRMTSASPRTTHVVAEIPNLYGRGMTAHMTYYETNAGAKVFAAGAFTLAGAIRQPKVARLMDNLFDR